jgi:hypothetical protein
MLEHVEERNNKEEGFSARMRVSYALTFVFHCF